MAHGRRAVVGELMAILAQLKRILSRGVSRADRRALATLAGPERKLIRAIQSRKLTYLSGRKLVSLVSTCASLRRRAIPGAFVEAGCALGGSAVLIASVKEPERPFRVYDVFGMIPPPGPADPLDVHERYRTIAQGKASGIGGATYYGYEDDLYSKVVANLEGFGIDLARSNVALIKGLVQDTLRADGPVAFAHVDVDWYEPVMTCLTRLYPKLSVGGSIILDDYHDWGGCRKAADEFMAQQTGTFALDDSAGSLKITRTSE